MIPVTVLDNIESVITRSPILGTAQGRFLHLFRGPAGDYLVVIFL